MHKNCLNTPSRSGCYASLERYQEALADGAKCVEIKPDWAKGYTRKGHAEFFLRKYDEAEATYITGLKLAPEDAALQQGLEKVKAAKTGGAGGRDDFKSSYNGVGARLLMSSRRTHQSRSWAVCGSRPAHS